MANINGLPVNSAVTHAEFMSRTEDTSTVAKISLLDPDVASGDSISNVQKAINKAFEGVGAVDENDLTINDYSSNNYILDGDDRKVAVGKLDAQLGTTQAQLTALDAINSQDVSLGAIGSTPNANGSTLTGQVLNLEPASASFGGVLTTATQSIAGDKTFVDDVTVSSTLTVTGLTTLNGDLVVNGTTTTVNSTTVDTVDPNITVNKTGNDASSEGAGLTVDRTGTKGSLKYENALASKFKIGDLAAESEVVTVSHTQTLTNKTLTSPVINTPTGITKTDVGLANVTNDSQLKRAAGDFSTFTEKTTLVADDVFIIEDSEASGVKKFVKKSNIGASGSGGGGAVNLIVNGSADDTLSSIFTPYADAAGTRPVDGTGGSPTVTTSISAVSPLTGTKSYLLTKPASNTQGQGWAVSTVPLDLSYRAKALKISVDYIVNSGTFAAGSNTVDSDIIWSCYDITNSKIMEPSNIKMFASSSTNSDKFEATVQFDYNCTSFRLMAHVATTSTAAYEIKVDNVTVSPSVYVYGAPITDMASVSTVTLSSGTNVNLSQHFQRREGDHIRQRGYITWNGAGSGGTFTVSLGGYTIDTNKINSSVQNSIEGYAMWLDNGTARKAVGVMYSTTTAIQFEELTSSSGVLVGTGFASGDTLSYEIVVPVVGLSSSVQMSDSADTRQFVVNAFTGAIALAAGATIPLATVRKDTHGAVVGNKIKIQTAGDYTAFALLLSSAATSIRIKKNGGSDKYIGSIVAGGIGGGSVLVPNLIAGDEIEFITEAAATITGSDALMMSLFRSPASSAIAANESVNAVYTTAAGQSIPNTTFTIIDFGTPEIDNHGRVTTGASWKFTANTSGIYEVSSYIQYNIGGGWTAGEECVLDLWKNGVSHARLGEVASQAPHGTFIPIAGAARQIRLISGDYIDLRSYHNSGAALSLNPSAITNWVSIKKVGN